EEIHARFIFALVIYFFARELQDIRPDCAKTIPVPADVRHHFEDTFDSIPAWRAASQHHMRTLSELRPDLIKSLSQPVLISAEKPRMFFKRLIFSASNLFC